MRFNYNGAMNGYLSKEIAHHVFVSNADWKSEYNNYKRVLEKENYFETLYF